MYKLEARINHHLNSVPALKKVIKRMYQAGMVMVSRKILSEGAITRVTPLDGREYFFGYYDKSPWDNTGQFMLCLRARDTRKSAAPGEPAEILRIDTQTGSIEALALTRAWNVQQGCMLQWLGPDFGSRILYNDFRGGAHCSVLLDLTDGREKVLPLPAYSVSADGAFALTLDFSRLHRLRKGYGYSNLPDATGDEKCPDKPCIWYMNLIDGACRPILRYTDLAAFEPRPVMAGTEHKVNHIMINPSGNRFLMLHRWFAGQKKYTRLVSANCDGTGLYNLCDDDMVSHCCWKSDEDVVAYARKRKEGNGYFLLTDRSQDYTSIWRELTGDGHPSFSPDGTRAVTDTYPDRSRVSTVYCIEGDRARAVARVFAPFRYDNDVRCDLHPRWNHTGDKVCLDAAFEGLRGLYVVNI